MPISLNAFNQLMARVDELESDVKRINRHVIQIEGTLADKDKRIMKLQTIVLEILDSKNHTSLVAKEFLNNDSIDSTEYLKRRNIG